MTIRQEVVLRCNECGAESIWDQSVLKQRTVSSIVENNGYVRDSKRSTLLSGTKHLCPDCNDRSKETFYVYDGYGDEYLGEIDAWGIVDARQVAWDTFNQENMVKRERKP